MARTLVTLKKGRFPIRVGTINPFPTVLHRFLKVANVSSVLLEQVRADREVSLTEVCPGVLEVGLVDVGEEVTEVKGGSTGPPSLKGACLTGEQQLQLDQLVQKWDHVFSKHEEDYGRTSVVKHRIPTGTAEPIKERYRPIPPTLYKEIRGLLQGMLTAGFVCESSSPWAAPIVLVQKYSRKRQLAGSSIFRPKPATLTFIPCS